MSNTVLPPNASHSTPTLGGIMPVTNGRFVKEQTGPDLDERPHSFSMSPNQAICSNKSIYFSQLAVARALTIRSWPKGRSTPGAPRCGRFGSPKASRNLEELKSVVEVKGQTARLLPVGERAVYLLGKPSMGNRLRTDQVCWEGQDRLFARHGGYQEGKIANEP